MPAHRAGVALERCLDALAALAPAPDELVVVVDGGDPAVAAAARARGLRVEPLVPAAGPAATRNRGVLATAAPIVVFVDSDVAPPPDGPARMAAVLAAADEVSAAYGSYDDRPEAPGVVSRFKNLLHHWTHQQAPRDASTFWTGFGAIRRSAFEAVGGFDPAQRWLEDVELGYRLRASGRRVVAVPELQATHLKTWTLGSLLTSDVLHRALPWTELIHRWRSFPAELNLSWTGRASVALVGLLAVGLLGTPWLGPPAALSAALSATALGVLNRGFYALLWRRGGPRLAAPGVALHWLTLLAGGIAFVVGSLRWMLRRRHG